MTLLKQLLIAGCILTTSLTQAIMWQGINYRAYNAYISKAIEELYKVEQDLQWKAHGPREIMCTGQGWADKLYPRQKAALKAILKELKIKARNSQNKGDAMLRKLFKSEIYKQWKQTFKKNYDESRKSNDHLGGWAWLHQPVGFIIHE